jgi:anhydro-N-acetylmuramic acid kinase
MDALAVALSESCVEPTDAQGVPGDAVEAMAFSLMGRNALLGVPNHLPRCTGAARAVVLGELSPGRGANPIGALRVRS